MCPDLEPGTCHPASRGWTHLEGIALFPNLHVGAQVPEPKGPYLWTVSSLLGISPQPFPFSALLLLNYILLCEYIYHILFIDSSGGGYLGYFHFSAIMNNAVINMHMHTFFCEHIFSLKLGV